MVKILFITHEMNDGGVSRLLKDIQKTLIGDNTNGKILTLFGQGEMFDNFTCDTLTNGDINIQKLRKNSIFLKLVYLLQSPIIVIKFLYYIRNYKPDIIVTNMWGSDIISLLVNKKGCQNIVSIQHDVVKIGPFLRVLKIMALKRADYVIAISQAVKQFLISYFKVPESKIKIIYNGIETKRFLSYTKNNTVKNLVFGTVARLDKIKGHIYTLEGLNLLKKQYGLTPKFIFVGDGAERAELEDYAKSHNLNNVEFVGQQLDISPYLSQIDVFILPSLSEGLGVAIIEAMTAAKCVIATNIDGIKELITDSETGFLVETQNSEVLCDKIKWCLDNHDKTKKIGISAQQYILDNQGTFDIKNSVLKYENLFKGLMAK